MTPHETDTGSSLFAELDALLRRGVSESGLGGVLDRVLGHLDCTNGTIHRLDGASGTLHLLAQRGLPEAFLERIRAIPIGKGMAGLAAERRQPVSVCNLQTDCSGVARPGAKASGMEGSIAVPILVDGRLCGVLGVAKPVAHDFNQAETDLLLRIGAMIGRHLA
jgi:L-methionine (R)-S-oxide reductase